MKVTGYCGAKWVPERKAIVLMPLEADIPLIEKLFAIKAKREEREGSSAFPEYSLELGARPHTWQQTKAVWALITVIFRAMHGRKPDNEEKYELYLDCLDLYADKTPNQFTGKLRAIHLSESDTYSCARFIEHLMSVIVEYCDLDMQDESGRPLDLAADVRQIFNRWNLWRGELAVDPLDYDANGKTLPYEEWRKTHKVSDASGEGGYLERAHIVTRGADAADIEESWNWIMLTPEEHRFQHQHGFELFLQQYPHLKGRYLRARSLAFKQ